MNTSETIGLYDKYVIGSYSKLPVVIVRGQGSRIWDADGKEYIDLFPGWGVSGTGHCHPMVVEAIRKQAGKLIHIPNNFYNEEQALLAKAVSEHSFGGKCFFCNSGAEAVEAAIKLTRKATPEGKYKIITMENSFHGRTLAAITATAQPKYQAGFGPMPEGFTYVPFNDLKAVEHAVDDKTAGIMVELIQGEGGINVADVDYVKGLRKLCDDRGLVLTFDEVQSCMGHSGKYFGYLHYGVTPDIMTMAKALGGGVAIGGIEAVPKVAAAFTPGTHASTFGGNSLACAAALAVFEAIEKEKLLANTVKMGEHFMKKLKAFAGKYSFIKEVRGKGLMIGVQLTIPGAPIVAKCLERGLNVNCTHDTVLRMLPAMNITKDEADKGLAILESALSEAK
jgi:acetylornithine/N-succinyldiaminopimelate aminotransferase